jgi:hypothetical protein
MFETSSVPFKFKSASSELNPEESAIHVIPELIVIDEGLVAPFILKLLELAPVKVKPAVAPEVLLKLNKGTLPEVDGSLIVLVAVELYVERIFGSPDIVRVGAVPVDALQVQ